MKWITHDNLGAVGFVTKQLALAAYPDRVAVPCEFSMGFKGWLALDRHGTENNNTVKTPDGREIPVVYGWTPYGKLIGMRGGTPAERMFDHWRAIMNRAIEVTFAVANTK